jgi:hypothetical protein
MAFRNGLGKTSTGWFKTWRVLKRVICSASLLNPAMLCCSSTTIQAQLKQPRKAPANPKPASLLAGEVMALFDILSYEALAQQFFRLSDLPEGMFAGLILNFESSADCRAIHDGLKGSAAAHATQANNHDMAVLFLRMGRRLQIFGVLALRYGIALADH